MGYKNGMKWVTRMYCFGLQKWNKTGYKNGMDWVTRNEKTYFFKSLHFGNFKNSVLKWVTKMEWIGLQGFQKPLSTKWVNISRMHFG